MLGAIRRGDKVVTGGGIMGTVTKVVNEDEVAVEIAEGIKIRVQRGLIASVQPKISPDGKDATSAGTDQKEGSGSGGMLGKLFGGGKK